MPLSIKTQETKPPEQTQFSIQDQGIKKVAEDFESLFLELVLKSMRKTVPDGGLITKGNAEDIYKSLLDTEYAKTMAQRKTTGLAEAIERELRSKIGKSDPPTPLHHIPRKEYNQGSQDGMISAQKIKI